MSIIAIFFAKYIEYYNRKNEIDKINKEFLGYEKSIVQINTIVTLMNKAILLNKENDIRQDENNIFKENNINSIKIYLETKASQSNELVRIPMEELMLNEKAGPEKVVYAFSDLRFEITKKEFHEKTGQIKEIIFTEII